jgi:hypothetical protein
MAQKLTVSSKRFSKPRTENLLETNAKVYNYTKYPYTHKDIWEQAILLLSKKEAEKALELINLEEKILQNQKKIDRIKPRAFKS